MEKLSLNCRFRTGKILPIILMEQPNMPKQERTKRAVLREQVPRAERWRLAQEIGRARRKGILNLCEVHYSGRIIRRPDLAACDTFGSL